MLPSEMWESLRMIHQARGFGTRMLLCRAFFKMQVRPGQSMASWIGDVHHAGSNLMEIGANLDDEDLVLVVTNGLPPSYKPLVINLDATPADELTFNYVIMRLLNEESRQATLCVSAAPSSTTATAASTSTEKLRRPLSTITCFKCNQKGHYQANCPLNTAPAAPAPAAAQQAQTAYAGEGEIVEDVAYLEDQW
ncbi:gag-polypeptide of LTR copia-type-domain-containing protein [Amylocystis lapponica]|nr:gag-polypeptide of LTR copia-type-domain-containing protein [Amylocystis lapponica]